MLAGLLLVAMALQIVLGSRLLSATFDETTHLPAGYSYLKTGDFRLNPQHPPLIKLLAALPLLPLAPDVHLDDPAWNAASPDEWAFGYRFLYAQDADRLLFWGRLPIALLALVLAGYVGCWARELFGNAAGLLALFLCVFSPTVLAHARFVTMDVGLACFSTMALYHLWRRLRGGGRRHIVLAGIGLGLALAAKFSGVVLVVSFAALIAAQVAAGGGASPGGMTDRLRRAALLLPALALSALIVVQASYFFSADPLLYVKGLAAVQADHDPAYPYYLLGEFRPGGWWYYFALAFLFKTPLPTLLLLPLAVYLALRGPRRPVVDELCLALPAALYFVVTSAFADNLGVRYLLPVYPLLFVFASRVAPWALQHAARRIALALLVAWYAGSALWIFPDQLAYFNELAGGPARGHRVLDDSNIDWSQDLKRLKTHLDERGIGRIKLHYGPNIAPDHYGIDAVPLSNAEWAGDPPPGVYAIGTHLLIRGEHYAKLDPRLKTNWLARYDPVARIGYSIYLFEFPP